MDEFLISAMDNNEIRQWLDQEWEQVLAQNDQTNDPIVDSFVNSDVVGVRYAFVTQLLGKVADPSRNLLALQAGAGLQGAWNARSFSVNVIVPWEAENHRVLGGSREPYASKPLRRPLLHEGMPDVKDKKSWDNLCKFFSSLEDASAEEIQEVFRRCLRSIARKLAKQEFEYPIPRRISINNLCKMLNDFLADPSRGFRPLVVSAALFDTIGEAFSLYSKVEVQGVNEADSTSGALGDISCYSISSDNVVLVIEVKDFNLKLIDLQSSITKARQGQGSYTSLLFAVPGVQEDEQAAIESRIEREWASGLNVYHVDIETLISTSFALLDETWRIKFIRNLCIRLDATGEHNHREAWRRMLA